MLSACSPPLVNAFPAWSISTRVHTFGKADTGLLDLLANVVQYACCGVDDLNSLTGLVNVIERVIHLYQG